MTILKQLTLLEKLRLPFYPITLLFYGPLRLIKTLYNSKVLAFGKWRYYNGYSSRYSVNQLFYKTQAINIDRHGRNGYSPTLALGNFYLGRLFHLSLPSTYLYHALGAMLPLLSMLVWLICHFGWYEITSVNGYWFMLVLLLATISTKFFAMAFIVQNYNVMGWAFFPLGVWGILNGHYLIASAAWLLVSLGSVTAVAITLVLSVVGALWTKDIYLIYAILPALAKALSHLFWLVSDKKFVGEFWKSFLRILRTIGAVSGGTKYKRGSSKAMSKTAIYFIIIYSQYIILQYIMLKYIDWYLLVGLALFIINTSFIRFSDIQGQWFTMFTLLTASILTNNSIIQLCSYWVAISPIPLNSGTKCLSVEKITKIINANTSIRTTGTLEFVIPTIIYIKNE